MKNRITILILTIVQLNLFSQLRIDSFLISHESDSALIRVKSDAIGNFWKIYPHKIIRVSENKSYNDSFSARFITSTTTIDSKFPLKTLFYNPNSNSIHILNSRWGTLSEIKLDNLGIYQASYVNYCSDGTIWILDKNTNHLFRINENATKKIELVNPFQVKNQSYFPQFIIDHKSSSIAIDSNYGYFSIDNYGSLISAFQLPSHYRIFEGSGNYFLQDEKGLYLLDLDIKTYQLRISSKHVVFKDPILDIVVTQNKLVIRTRSNELYYYRNFLGLFRQ